MEVKKYVMFLTENVWTRIWYAYDHDVMVIINETEFLKIGDYLLNNPDECVFFELTVLYPKRGLFERCFLPQLKQDTFVCQHI